MKAVSLPNRCRAGIMLALLALLIGLPGSARAQNNLAYQGGAVVHGRVSAYLIYWVPAGVVLDSTVSDGTGNFKTITQNFFNWVGGTSYFNILTQFPDKCGGPQCTVDNSGPGSVTLAGAWTDSSAYPHAGTTANPLTDSDIQAEVAQAIATNHWRNTASSEFFVFTGAGIQECQSNGTCTDTNPGFCAYHGSFSNAGSTVLYGYMSDASFNTAGCAAGIASGVNGQVASDREVVIMSHEFFETMSDPFLNAWLDPATGNEIGDNCNQQGTPVFLGGGAFDVQRQWSNKAQGCVISYLLPIFTNITPTSGPATGGTTLTFSGGGFTGTSSVTFSDDSTFPPIPAENFAFLSDSSLTASTPPCPGTGCGTSVGFLITVKNNYGTASAPVSLDFHPYAAVLGVNPGGGSTAGGTKITVTGNGFDNSGPYPGFTIGGIPPLDVYCQSNTQCTMVTPAAPPGTYDVTMNGTLANSTDKFSYAAPILSSITPNSGSEDGGTLVTFNGANLAANMQADFGGDYVGVHSCANAGQCTAYAPRGTGIVPVTIGGTLQSTPTAQDYFKYVAVPSGYLDPGTGTPAGGTATIAVLHNILAGAQSTSFSFHFSTGVVQVPSAACTPSILSNSDTNCTLLTPPLSPAGPGPQAVPVSVTYGGTTIGIGNFNYVTPAPPVNPKQFCQECADNGGRCMKRGSTWICKCQTVSAGGLCE